ncbi:MAG TPA: 6-bladed beta-propeller, partial [Burkholderiales bacterium]|nr:6-bladed beta-propeller [Burkholderiales bacterium]
MNNLLRVLVIGCVVAAVAACAPVSKKADLKEAKPIVFPEPPDEPRFVFERAIYASADVVPEAESEALRRSLTGEGKGGEPLGKPYGVAVKGGKVYVSDSTEGAVKMFDIPHGKFQRIGQDAEGGALGQPL